MSGVLQGPVKGGTAIHGGPLRNDLSYSDSDTASYADDASLLDGIETMRCCTPATGVELNIQVA